VQSADISKICCLDCQQHFASHYIYITLIYIVEVEHFGITTPLNMKGINLKGCGENQPYTKVLKLIILIGARIWR
jgi:hypothetical protein